MATIICNTKFKLDPFADGGSKRSVQIREYLEDNNCDYYYDSFILPKGLSAFQLMVLSIRAVIFINKYYPRNRIRSLRNYIRLVKYYALRIPVVYDKYKKSDVIFAWENTNDQNIVYLMKATGHPVLAFPHNIESLVSLNDARSLKNEMDVLAHCDAVFAISKEETWLLRLQGVNAYYYPYQPPKRAEEYFITIRKKRTHRETNGSPHYLLLGSATNVPTREGMQTILDNVPKDANNFHLWVAGYGTDSLNCPLFSNIHFKGALSANDLEPLLVNADAIIIYQPPTTGSLTRIPEMLMAGIPVIANDNAARNYYSVDGVRVYHSIPELLEILDTRSQVNVEGCPIDSYDREALNQVLRIS